MSVHARKAEKQPTNTAATGGNNVAGIRITAVALGVSVLAACATPAPEPVYVPPPPPPPPPVEIIPYRPLPPGGAAYVMNIPSLGSDGLRQTIHRGISDDEKVWHFRAGWNAAALNCTAPEYSVINQTYNTFINQHQRTLVRVNNRIEEQYRKAEGSRRAALLAREEKLTKVYNFFSLPPARRQFCRTMLEMANNALAMPPTDPIAFALENFAILESPFNTFFADYETYERESAAWDARYGATYGSSQDGWVAVQKARLEGNPNVPTVGESSPTSTLANPNVAAGVVTDAETGAEVPVIPVDDDVVSQPVVQPIPNDSPEDTPQRR